MTAPEVDDRLPVEHHGDSGAKFVVRGEVLREHVAHAGEAPVARPLDGWALPHDLTFPLVDDERARSRHTGHPAAYDRNVALVHAVALL